MGKISQMPLASSISGSDYVEVVQNGINKKASVSLLSSVGPAGASGKSAYEVAIANGYSGTEAQWLVSLKGVKGDTGNTGPVGPAGPTGPAGPAGLQGIRGDVGPQGVKGDTGLQGIQGLQGLTGPQGPIGLTGNTGPQGPQGIQGIPGPSGITGTTGKSAYEVAVQNGFSGTQSQWLASLVGPAGSGGSGTDTQSYVLRNGNSNTVLQIGQNVDYVRLSQDVRLVKVSASLSDKSVTGPVVIDLNVNGVSILDSSKLTIGENQVSTFNLNFDIPILFPNIRKDSKISIDIDSAGVGAAGLSVVLVVEPVTLAQASPTPGSVTSPVISGIVSIGSVLTATSGAWSNNPYAFNFEWMRNGVVVNWKANNQYGENQYVITSADAFADISVRVTAVNDGWFGVSNSAVTHITPPVPENTQLPFFTSTLTHYINTSIDPGTWLYGNGIFRYQIYRYNAGNWEPVQGATGINYVPTQADIGMLFRVGVITSNVTGASEEAFSTPVIVQPSTYDLPWPPPAIDPTTLRDMTVPLVGTGNGRTINVGPGKEHTELETVPWLSLGPGDVVNIFYRPLPYTRGAKIGLKCIGTEANPVRINGVWDALGNMPILEANGSTTPLDTMSDDGVTEKYFSSQYFENLGLISIYHPRPIKAAWIYIEGLWLRNAYAGSTFTDQFGRTSGFIGGSAGIWALTVENLYVQRNWITGHGNGVFTNTWMDEEARTSRYIYIRFNGFLNNGHTGASEEAFGIHDAYIQAGRTLYEGNYWGPLRPGSHGAQLKDRGSGTVFRYNWVDAGSSLSAPLWLIGTDGGVGTVAGVDPLYDSIWCYGNVIRSAKSLIPSLTWEQNFMFIGIANSAGPEEKKGPFYFYNNTVLMQGGAAENIWAKNGIFLVDGATLVMSSNIFWIPDTPITMAMNSAACTKQTYMIMGGTNWISNTYIATNTPTPSKFNFQVQGTLLTGTDPLVDVKTFQLIEGSPCINGGVYVLSSAPEPAVVSNLQVEYSPNDMSEYYKMVDEPNPAYKPGYFRRTKLGVDGDLGAYETDVGIAPPPPPPPPSILEPDVNGIFNMTEADGTTLYQINYKFGAVANDFIISNNALQGTSMWNIVARYYANGQGADQYTSLTRLGASHTGGSIFLFLQSTDQNNGYRIELGSSNYTIFKNGGWVSTGTFTNNWAVDCVISAKIVSGVLGVYINGSQVGQSYTDSSNVITGGYPGFGLYLAGVAGTVHRISEWTDNAF